jgi:hypothetical protein
MSTEAIKYTPGPWVVDPAVRQGFTVYAPKEGFIVGTQDEEGRYGAIESEANARLIAAAPDLLALAERIARLPEHGHYLALIDEARATIAKATGEKS